MLKNDEAIRERILSELKRLSKDGAAPGRVQFFKETNLNEYQMRGFWRTYSDAVREAGLVPNKFGEDFISHEVLLKAIAGLTRELGHFPTQPDLIMAKKQKGDDFPGPETFRKRFGNKPELLAAVNNWVLQNPDFQDIESFLSISGKAPLTSKTSTSESIDANLGTLSESFLPPIVSCLAEMARGAAHITGACLAKNININTDFERRVAIAFELLGLDVTKLGQGKGRDTDGVAKCIEKRWAIVYDAKVRSAGYRLLTDDDRKFREYIERQGENLKREGVNRFYFAVVSSGFSDRDVSTAKELCRTTNAKSCVLVEAAALMHLIERRLSQSSSHGFDEIERHFLESKILRAADLKT